MSFTFIRNFQQETLIKKNCLKLHYLKTTIKTLQDFAKMKAEC